MIICGHYYPVFNWLKIAVKFIFVRSKVLKENLSLSNGRVFVFSLVYFLWIHLGNCRIIIQKNKFFFQHRFEIKVDFSNHFVPQQY